MTKKNIYDGVEDLSNFKTESDLELYRESILNNNKNLINFVKKNIKFDPDDSVFDIGSGNCGFLISLSSRIDSSMFLGLEPAKTRFEFSKKWIDDLNLKNLIIKDDLFNNEFTLPSKASKIFVLDNTLLVIAGQTENNYRKILSNITRNIDQNGELILEFILLEEFQQWSKTVVLDHDTRFSRTEYDMSFSEDGKTIISSSKRYLRDSSNFLHKEDFLSGINSSEIIESLNDLGFKILNTYTDLPWVGDDLPRRILIHSKWQSETSR